MEMRPPMKSATRFSPIAEVPVLGELDSHARAYRAACDALGLEPDNPKFLGAKGSALYQWGRYREAIEAYVRAEARDGLGAGSCVEMGWALFFTGRLAEAEVYMRRAIDAAP